MDRLRSLTTFTQVVDSGGFSAAAKRLNMSATMVSSHVQALEETLGARLLNRTTRKVSLTEIGQAYYESCARILAELEEADRIAGALHQAPRGTLRLHIGTHIIRFVAPVVAEYMKLYPQVMVELTMGERVADMVEDGFDLAVCAIQPPDSSLIARQLTGWRHILCCAPGYLKWFDEPKTLSDLARHNCLRFAFYPYGDEWRFEDADGEIVTQRVKGTLRSNSAEALRIAALESAGILLGPSFLIAEDVKAGRLVRLIPDHQPVPFAVNALYPHRKLIAAKVRLFLDLAAQRLRPHEEWLEPGGKT